MFGEYAPCPKGFDADIWEEACERAYPNYWCGFDGAWFSSHRFTIMLDFDEPHPDGKPRLHSCPRNAGDEEPPYFDRLDNPEVELKARVWYHMLKGYGELLR